MVYVTLLFNSRILVFFSSICKKKTSLLGIIDFIWKSLVLSEVELGTECM